MYVSTAKTNRTINNVLAADVVGFRAEPVSQRSQIMLLRVSVTGSFSSY